MNKTKIRFVINADAALPDHINVLCDIAERFIKDGCPENASYPIYTNWRTFSADRPDDTWELVRDVTPDKEELYEKCMGVMCRAYPDNINELIDELHEFSGAWHNTLGTLQHMACMELEEA